MKLLNWNPSLEWLWSSENMHLDPEIILWLFSFLMDPENVDHNIPWADKFNLFPYGTVNLNSGILPEMGWISLSK